MQTIDAVFEGGGVKGIGLVGAIAETERRGYRFGHLAGTSAGAIVAALLAAGYTATELEESITKLDYRSFQDKNVLSRLPLLGPLLNILVYRSLYMGDVFESWLRELLAAKGISTFADLIVPEQKDDPRFRYKLRVIASDISRGKLLILPQDIRDYGLEPDQLEVARAVRMSMGIPYFFRPVVLNGHYLVDGGILSNFPVWLFDDAANPSPTPTLGYKLVEPDEGQPKRITGAFTLFRALVETMLEAHDARYIEDSNFARTVAIPTLGVQSTDFDISKGEQKALFRSGQQAAARFLEQWSYDEYRERFG